jgi:hypothetical protein
VETFEADRGKGQVLLEALAALDWGEPTPDSSAGRDGVILSGALTTDVGFRSWTSWSPEAAVEPAKAAYFRLLRDFAVDHASGDVVDQLIRATS